MISRYRSSRPGMYVLLEPEDVRRAVERIGEGVDVVAFVVEIPACPRRRRDVEDPHERFRAVVPGADTHVALVEDLRDVVRVQIAELEAEHAATHRWVGW